jgi:hypothetical protein
MGPARLPFPSEKPFSTLYQRAGFSTGQRGQDACGNNARMAALVVPHKAFIYFMMTSISRPFSSTRTIV